MSGKIVTFGIGLLCLGVLASCAQQEAPAAGLESQALAAPAFSSLVVAQHSGRCADVYKSSLSVGTDLVQYDCHGKANQRFTFHPVAGKADTYI